MLIRSAEPNGIYETICVIKSNKEIVGEYRLLILEAPDNILNCHAGQFFHLLCPINNEKQPYLRRPMSIYGFYPAKNELHFLYKVTGEGTRSISGLVPGKTLNILGPLGNGFTIQENWQHLLVVARGVGLATLAPLADEARRKNRKMTVICSARTPQLLMSVDHFTSLGAQIIPVTDSEGTSSVENLEQIIEQQISDHRIDAFYTCGSQRILRLLQELGFRHNIPGEIALEQQMACGIGMCQCCVRSIRRAGVIIQERVCKEGPVFTIAEVLDQTGGNTSSPDLSLREVV